MSLYPVFLDLHDAACLVVGAGAVGCRRATGLLAAGVRELRLIDPCLVDFDQPLLSNSAHTELPAARAALLAHPAVRAIARAFETTDIDGCSLVCAASNNPTVNAAVAAACRTAQVPCSVANNAESGTCLIPAQFISSGMHFALTSEGISPAMTGRIKAELDIWVTEHYKQQLALLARLRPLVMDCLDSQAERAVVFQNLATKELGDALCTRDLAACSCLLQAILPLVLHIHIPELLHELA